MKDRDKREWKISMEASNGFIYYTVLILPYALVFMYGLYIGSLL